MTQFRLPIALVGIFMLLCLCQSSNCPQGTLLFDADCIPIQFIEGCALYNPDGSCRICQYGYMSSGKKCQYNPKANQNCCGKFSDNGQCEICAPGLYLKGNTCLRYPLPGCLVKRGTTCLNCDQKFYNQNGYCQKRLQGCKLYLDNGLCADCQDGYIKERGICIKNTVILANKPDNCVQTNEYSCIKCEKNYYLTRQGTCQQFGPGCIGYNRQMCTTCLPIFDLINGKCVIQGCKSYGIESCTQCDKIYKLTYGTCQLPNCILSRSGQCKICAPKFRLQNGNCVPPIQDSCKKCGNGFFLGSDGNCHFSIVGCAKYGDNGCALCRDGFNNKNGRCEIKGCADGYLTQEGCKKCNYPFLLTKQATCALPNCAILSQDGCLECNQGYHLKDGFCQQNDKLCKNYKKNTKLNQLCVNCLSGYILNQNNDCILEAPGCVYQNGVCISCSYPFIKNGQGLCIIPGCIDYNMKGCVSCKNPYVLKNNMCVVEHCSQLGSDYLCTKCQTGFHLTSSRQCIADVYQCVAYSQDGNCKQCKRGWSLNSEFNCIKNLDFCIQMNDAGKCIECQKGYNVVQGVCQLADPFCESFNSNNGCKRCKKGYHIQNSVCFSNDPYCLEYVLSDNTQYCKSCKELFTLDQNRKCVPAQPGCIYKKGICVNCVQPFRYNKQQRSCFIFGCSSYNADGCYKCASPFQISGKICAIPFCTKYSSNGCQQCESGYSLLNGACQRRDSKCVQYNSNGVCTMCINGYVAYQGNCIKQDKNCLQYSKKGGCNKCKEQYFISEDQNCLPKQPGCIYQNGVCTYCKLPFQMHPVAKKCRINGCLQANNNGCTTCKYPFEIVPSTGQCQIPHCTAEKDGACARCALGFHLRQGRYCVQDQPSCLKYNDDGDCQLCDKKYMIMSNGECQLKEQTCIQKSQDGSKCLACKDGYFINKFYQCQRVDDKCTQYTNGVCSQCAPKYFLYDYICFPFSPGCVKYFGKDCTLCRKGYELVNGECFIYKKPALHLEGEDDQYDFEITPIDITKSKYYIKNLSPVSAIGKLFYSSVYGANYTNPSLTNQYGQATGLGWRSEHPRQNEYIGYTVKDDPVTFFAVQIQNIQDYRILQFYLQYSVDGQNYIRVQTPFKCEGQKTDIQTLYFTGIYAKAIRIIITSFYGWPAGRFEFFYYDYLRFKKISNLKSLKYLTQSIQSNFVDRVDNQLYINQRYFFQPEVQCQQKDVCWTGFQLCHSRKITDMTLKCTGHGSVTQFYIMYSIDGKVYNCYEKCRKINVGKQSPFRMKFDNLTAKNIRVYPTGWEGHPNFAVSYNYQ